MKKKVQLDSNVSYSFLFPLWWGRTQPFKHAEHALTNELCPVLLGGFEMSLAAHRVCPADEWRFPVTIRTWCVLRLSMRMSHHAFRSYRQGADLSLWTPNSYKKRLQAWQTPRVQALTGWISAQPATGSRLLYLEFWSLVHQQYPCPHGLKNVMPLRIWCLSPLQGSALHLRLLSDFSLLWS